MSFLSKYCPHFSQIYFMTENVPNFFLKKSHFSMSFLTRNILISLNFHFAQFPKNKVFIFRNVLINHWVHSSLQLFESSLRSNIFPLQINPHCPKMFSFQNIVTFQTISWFLSLKLKCDMNPVYIQFQVLVQTEDQWTSSLITGSSILSSFMWNKLFFLAA